MKYQILLGDCLSTLKQIEDQSVNCCITSPPYYLLRDYLSDNQIGLEHSPEEYINKLVEVFREVKRVLRDDGVLWINIADTYAGSGKGVWNNKELQKEVYVPHSDSPQAKAPKTWPQLGIKTKDLIGIPWELAFALRADGWYLRQEIIWNKPNAMPSSVKDRCATSHESLFLLSKSPKYYFNIEALLEPAECNSRKKVTTSSIKYTGQHQGRSRDRGRVINGVRVRNKRSVWNINTRPYQGGHFATFPPDLIIPCVEASCPERGTVLDPFSGSGTTIGVAVALSRRAIACEINEEYAQLIPNRIDEIIRYIWV